MSPRTPTRHLADRTPRDALESIPDTDLDAIRAAIRDIEADRNVTVLAARDVGSHAWNLANDDSDYDIALLFRQPPEAYYQLGEELSTLDQKLSHTVDAIPREVEFKAWNITKFGELVNESNASALRFLASPIRYLDEEHAAMDDLEELGLSSFRPGALIGHAYGQAGRMYRDNFVRRLRHKPTEHKTDTRREQFEVLPESADAVGTITAQSATDGHTEPVHLSEAGPGEKWGLVKRKHVQKDEWTVVEADEESDTLIVTHEDSGERRELSYAAVESGELDEWEWASTDRRVKRFVYVVRSILTAAYVAGVTIADEPRYPPTNFLALIHVYEDLPDDAQVIDLPLDTIREYAEQKRSAEAGDYLEEWHADEIEAALDDLESLVHDGRFHQRRIERARVNEIIDDVLAA